MIALNVFPTIFNFKICKGIQNSLYLPYVTYVYMQIVP